MKNLQKIYEEAYKKKWDEVKGKSSIRIFAGKKMYEEDGNFFLCGFNSLVFSYKGKNTKLKKKLKEQGIETGRKYGGGLYFNLKQVGNRGNGDFLIQQEAYNKVSGYLCSLGYDVYANSRLD